MARPRLHPRRLYRAVDSGFYTDQETGDELDYFKGQTILPDPALNIPMGRQEKIVKKLAGWGVFEPFDAGDEDEPEVIERVSAEPTTIKE